MDDIEDRGDEQEGKFNRFRNAAEDGCNRSRNEQGSDFLALFRFGTIVHGQGCARQAEDFGTAVKGKAALGEQVPQGMSTGGEVIEVLQPVRLDATVADSRAVDEGQIDEVVQTGRQEDAFREGVRPDAEDAAGLEEELELFDAVLDGRPDVAEEERHGQHDQETDSDDEGRALEDAEPVRDFCIIKTVMQVRRDAGDEDSAEHAHVQGLDVGNHGQSRTGTGVLTVIDAEVTAVQGQDTGDEIVEDHVDDEAFHGAAGLFLLGKANGNGDGKEDRHLIEDRPGPLLDDVPEIVPESPFFCQAAEETRVAEDDRQGDGQPEEGK